MTVKRYRIVLTIGLLTLALLAASVALSVGLATTTSRAMAQQAANWISELDCSGSPEVVVLKNSGLEPQNLAGWKLESDPPEEESLDLTQLAIIWPTQTIMIESGPTSEAAFTWSRKYVFRDADPTDYVRIVDDKGVVQQQIPCATVATPTPTPSPTALPASAAPAPAELVPEGGGSPNPSLDFTSPALTLVLGGSLATAGLAILIAPWLATSLWPAKRRHAAPDAMEQLAAPIRPGPASTVPRQQTDSSRPYLLLAILLLATAALVIFLLQPGDKK